MRKIVVFLILLVSSVTSFAQMENIQISKTVKIDKLYAGILSWTQASIDSLHATGEAGVRLGAEATWRPNKWIAVQSMTVFQEEVNNKSWAMNLFMVIINPVEDLKITIGNIGTLMTEQRPLPATASGQFETFTEAQIPGAALGAKAVWNVSQSVSVGAGVAQRQNQPEYQAMFGLKKFKISGFYREYDKRVGGALTAEIGRVTNITAFRQDEVLSNIFLLFLGPERDWILYSDTGYDLAQKELVRGEAGILKEFSGKYIKGLIGPGYCHEARSARFYLFVHL